jgi:hypothetical protein
MIRFGVGVIRRISTTMKRALIATFSLCCLSASVLLGSSITIGSDNAANDFPFSGPFFGYAGTDYQEAYASTDFSGPIEITGIDFFLGDDFTGTLYAGTYTLSLSVITSDIGSLSSTDLSSNLGSDNTVFETVTLSGAAPSTLTFTGTPFTYNPADGNLLLDISVAGGKGGSTAAYEDNNGVGTAIARYQNFGMGNGDGLGLVTEFDSNVGQATTPEPASLSLLLGCGLAGLLVRRSRRQTSKP